MIIKASSKTLIVQEVDDEIRTRLVVEELGVVTVYTLCQDTDKHDLMESTELICRVANQQPLKSRRIEIDHRLREAQKLCLLWSAILFVWLSTRNGQFVVEFAAFGVCLVVLAWEPAVFWIRHLRGKMNEQRSGTSGRRDNCS